MNRSFVDFGFPSVVIPVYNGEKYIRNALNSAINQTLRNVAPYEIIAVDDGSTDSTPDILAEYKKNYKIKVVTKENGGTGSALNAGIRAAKGHWIKWLSADDEMLPDCLESMLSSVDEDHYAIYYTHYHIIDKNGKFVRDFIETYREASDLWKMFYGNGSTSLIHRDVFDRCGMFEELPHSEDYEFWLRATQLCGIRLVLIPRFTINYRYHPDQLTHRVGGRLDKSIKDSVMQRLAALKH